MGGFAMVLLAFYLITPQISDLISDSSLQQLDRFEVKKPNVKYGFNLDDFEVEDSVVEQNEFFAKILSKCYVDQHAVHRLVQSTSTVFDARQLRAGKNYSILTPKGCSAPSFLIYEDSPFCYIQYDLQNFCAQKVEKPKERRLEVVTGTIEKGSSLYKSMIDAGIVAYQNLTNKMEKAIAWSVDFHHLQEGDQYKVYYEKIYVDGEEMSAGDLIAVQFKHRGKDLYSIKYNNGDISGYYDDKGFSAKKAFLKAPVEFSRISSRYNLRRYHPVLKHVRAHLGTDYAAPTGTPIVAVGDGVVEKAEFSGGNGNYVKIRHNSTYQTQYLHMSKFAKGIRPGTYVKQGEVIGYVGSTGLASGPHVCFRFWKNGKQVDFLTADLPNSTPMPKAELPSYLKYKDAILALLDKVPYPVRQEVASESQKQQPNNYIAKP
jgi:murein DD-endopeptidase MepM/ murein hydrolase activator NlpD